MKNVFTISLVAALMLLSSCAKKETPQVNVSKSDKPANPHAGMNMDAPPLADPNKPMPKDDIHAGMTGMGDQHKAMPNDDVHSGMGSMSGMPEMTPPPNAGAAVKDGMINVEGLTGKLPPNWVSVPPVVSMRLAQFRVTGGAGDKDAGEVSVFYLGPSAGGVEANIERWYGQFAQPDGKPTSTVAKRENITVGNLKATIVSFTGTMGASTMPGAPGGGEKAGWMNLSAIVETPNGPIFFKGTGPEKTMKAQESAVKDFVKSLKYAQ